MTDCNTESLDQSIHSQFEANLPHPDIDLAADSERCYVRPESFGGTAMRALSCALSLAACGLVHAADAPVVPLNANAPVAPKTLPNVPIASPPAASAAPPSPPASASPPAAAPATPGHREPKIFKDITPHSPHELLEGHDEHLHTGHAEEPEYWFASGEYLLLRPRRAAFDFAISDENRDLVPTGRIQSLNYELRSGVRVGLGARLGCTAWVADVSYTYLRSGADRDLTAPPGGTLYATLTRPGLNDEALTAQATARLEYNVYDATVGRWVRIDSHTGMRLYGGFRFASIANDFRVQYDGRDANLGRVRVQSNFDGFGPVIGGELATQFGNNWELFARGQSSLLTGTLRNPITETNNAGLTTYAALDYSTRRVIPTLGLAIGAGWHYKNVSLRGGYEIQNWFGMIDTPRFTGELAEAKFTTRSGDLSVEGLFFQLGIAY
jgi:hypothetical protein